jgi:hypothetical protein
VTLGERFQEILDGLPAGWSQAQVVLTVPEEAALERATVILASLTPGRAGSTFRVTVVPTGQGGPSPETVRRALDRLERDGIDARLAEPQASSVEVAVAPEEHHRRGLADAWDEVAATFPDDWSDAYLEVELASTDDVDRAALLLSPVNPFLLERDRPALRFRSAHRFGYGAAPVMTRRVLARLDEDRIAGTLRLLRLHSDMHPVLTQGPVWREDGRAV